MKTVGASLSIEVNVECPHCEELIDLMKESETNGYDHNEEGQVIIQACPDGTWYDKHKEFEINNVTCSECEKAFNVAGLEW